jgi:hypothetical protein
MRRAVHGSSLRLIVQPFQQQREAERDSEINYFDAGSRLLKLRRNVVPNRTSAVIFWQLLYQYPRVGERGQRRHCRDDNFLGQGARPIRLQLHDTFSHACTSIAFYPSCLNNSGRLAMLAAMHWRAVDSMDHARGGEGSAREATTGRR